MNCNTMRESRSIEVLCIGGPLDGERKVIEDRHLYVDFAILNTITPHYSEYSRCLDYMSMDVATSSKSKKFGELRDIYFSEYTRECLYCGEKRYWVLLYNKHKEDIISTLIGGYVGEKHRRGQRDNSRL